MIKPAADHLDWEAFRINNDVAVGDDPVWYWAYDTLTSEARKEHLQENPWDFASGFQPVPPPSYPRTLRTDREELLAGYVDRARFERYQVQAEAESLVA